MSDIVLAYEEFLKSGAIGEQIPGVKGLVMPDSRNFILGRNPAGIRERYFVLNPEILRTIAKRVGVIVSIHNLRAMQIRRFAQVSFNDDEVGFRIKLKKKNATPNRQQQKEIEAAEEYFLWSGLKDFAGAEDRDEGMLEVLELLVREILTIDQIAISLRKNVKGDIIDYWLLDGATIKRTEIDLGYNGDKSIKFVQEINNRVVETFKKDDLIFTFTNRVTEIRRRGYGYSMLEMSIDMVTAWLFAMAYNKEFFNTSSLPKGFMSFSGEKIDEGQLEDLQRQWMNMFRGIKGMWKTPFIQYNAKWQNLAPSNRDMEFSEYTQMLASWVYAIHGTDAQEVGMRLNQAQNVLNENSDAKINYSQDRGLKNLLFAIQGIYNKIIDKIPIWEEFKFEFSGVEVKNQKDVLEVEEKQMSTYMTINEKRKEKDLPADEYGDIIENQSYVQYKLAMQQMQQQQDQQQQEGGMEDQDSDQESGGVGSNMPTVDADALKPLKKSVEEYIEIIL